VIADPSQQLGVASGIVADRAGGDPESGGKRDLDFVGVAVGVDTDHGVDEFCQHGHGLLLLLLTLVEVPQSC
jgi:hypothetical protein